MSNAKSDAVLRGEVVVCQAENGEVRLDVRLDQETVWLTGGRWPICSDVVVRLWLGTSKTPFEKVSQIRGQRVQNMHKFSLKAAALSRERNPADWMALDAGTVRTGRKRDAGQACGVVLERVGGELKGGTGNRISLGYPHDPVESFLIWAGRRRGGLGVFLHRVSSLRSLRCVLSSLYGTEHLIPSVRRRSAKGTSEHRYE